MEANEPNKLAELTLECTGVLDLMPKGAISIRIHSIGGWGAITTGKNVAMTAFLALGRPVLAVDTITASSAGIGYS